MAIRLILILVVVLGLMTGCTTFTSSDSPETADVVTPSVIVTGPQAHSLTVGVKPLAKAPDQAVVVSRSVNATTTPKKLSLSDEEMKRECGGWNKLPTSERKKRENSGGAHCWRRVGADPYKGGVAEALAISGWPGGAQNALLNRVNHEVKGESEVMTNDLFDWSTFGRLNKDGSARFHRNVIAAWKAGEVHDAEKYSATVAGVEYHLYKVADCGNWAGVAIPIRVPVAPPPPAKPVGCDGSSDMTLSLETWPHDLLPDDIRKKVEDRVSRDITRQSYDMADALPPQVGPAMMALHQSGALPFYEKPYKIRVVVLEGNNSLDEAKVLWEGSVTEGLWTMSFPRQEVEGKRVAIIHLDSDVVWPTKDWKGAHRNIFVPHGCDFHTIASIRRR
ncbi:MAG: hypothetical protein AAB545_01065 [Patescibacteria group bacterium]